MNGSVVMLVLAVGAVYLYAMSALGRWLARSRESASAALVAPLAAETSRRDALVAHERIAS